MESGSISGRNKDRYPPKQLNKLFKVANKYFEYPNDIMNKIEN